jgi:hypothetical protein
VDAFGYLYTIATVGMTFAGLSVLTMILRQMLGGQEGDHVKGSIR